MGLPIVEVEYSGSRHSVTGVVDIIDPNKVNYSHVVSALCTLTGWIYYDGPSKDSFSFSTNVPPPEILRIYRIDVAEQGTYSRNYQPVPEDELQTKFYYNLVDDYPWRRDIMTGGEQVDQILEFDKTGQVIEPIAQTAQVFDENGVPFNCINVISSLSDRGYISAKRAETSFGKQAVGFKRVGNVAEDPNQTLHDGPLSSVTTNSSAAYNVSNGIPYYVGLVNGILVADPQSFLTSSIKDGLVCWLHCGEHPYQPYILNDHSQMAMSSEDVESGMFTANYSLSDRVWDSSRGWMLALKKSADEINDKQVTIRKNRLTGKNFAISLWIKHNGVDARFSGEHAVFSYGPIKFTVSQTDPKDTGKLLIKAYVKNAESYSLIGSIVSYAGVPEFVGISFDSIENSGKSIVEVVKVFEDDVILNGITEEQSIAPGEKVLVIGQTDAKENGAYFASESTWQRAASVDQISELNLLYKSLSDGSTYVCQNTSDPVYGTDDVLYQKITSTIYGSIYSLTPDSLTSVGADATATFSTAHGLISGQTVRVNRCGVDAYNGEWTITSTTPTSITFKLNTVPSGPGTGNTIIRTETSGIVCLNEFTASDTDLTLKGPEYKYSPDIHFSDVMIWNTFKSVNDLWNVEKPVKNPLTSAVRPTFVENNEGDISALEVLDSGYVFPNVWPIDYSSEILYRSQPYTGNGEYCGPDHKMKLGLGDGVPVSGTVKLGDVCVNNSSSGLHVASSTSSMLPGYNEYWQADSTSGHYRRIELPFDPDSATDNTSLVDDIASSYHPTELEHQNPGQHRIYVKGEDNMVYRVSVHVKRSGITDTPELFAQPVSGIISSTSPSYKLLSAGDRVIEVMSNAVYYDLVVRSFANSFESKELVTDAVTLLSRSGIGKLGVVMIAGEPRPVMLPDSGVSTPPIFLYSPAQSYLDYHMPENNSSWLNYDDESIILGIPNRNVAGPLIFSGTDAVVSAGIYRLVLDVTNLGIPDSEFDGFDVDVSITAFQTNGLTGAGATQHAVLLPEGTPTFSVKYSYGASSTQSKPKYCNCLPTGDGSLQEALDEIASVTGGATVLQTDEYNSVLGGPMWVRFNTVGEKPLLTFNTNKGLTVATIREVSGDGTTNEIQKIVFNRPMTVIELKVNDEILHDSTHYWNIQVYFNNPKITETTERRLGIHGIWFYRVSSQLYQVDPTVSGIDLQLVEVPGGSTPATHPGGFVQRISQSGVVSFIHEKDVLSYSPIAGDEQSNPDLPSSHLLTADTDSRTSSLISQKYSRPDIADPAAMETAKITLSRDAGTTDPNSPNLEILATLI